MRAGRGRQDLERLDLEELESCSDALDRAVDATPGVDRFCSRSAWVLSYHRAFGSERELHTYRRGDAFALLALERTAGDRAVAVPLEAMWAFSCPLAGREAGALLARLRAGPLAGLPIWLAGVPPHGPATRSWLDALRGAPLRLTGETVRSVASLEGGIEAFLGRRTRAFRRSLRAACRRVADAGISFEAFCPARGDVERLYARVLDVEHRSWKTATGNSAASGPMAAFYAAMWPRLAGTGTLRLWMARDGDGRDVGYLHGAVLDDRFRGLQFSFDTALRSLGLGNALQLEALSALCDEGVAHYDLGAVAPYKERWAERREPTVGILVLPG